MKPLLLLPVVILCGCGTVSNMAKNPAVQALARSAITATARYYGGDNAAQLASAGLSATAEVIQGYVDQKPPLQVAAASAGVKGVSQVVVDFLRKKGYISQTTVDNLHAAAEVAANATERR